MGINNEEILVQRKEQIMKDFETLVMNQDFSLTKKPTGLSKLPGLGAPVQVQKVMV